jgi:hypothetical protein
MFNLDQAISEWRRQMLDAGIKTPVPLEELENHLREEIDRQIQSGANAQQAFERAIQRIGQASALKSEFTKVGGTIQNQVKHLLLTFAGIPNLQLANTMNTSYPNASIEPAWVTYLKGAVFTIPAAFFWLFSAVFLLPKLTEICQLAGTSLFDFSGAPAVFRTTTVIGRFMLLLTHYGVLISGVVILMLILLEWRFSQWPRYRRAAIGIGAFLLNATVLISITMMVISALIAAPALLYHAK